MIVCVSRRTDVPAFHSEWFMNRIRAGYAMVRNPVYHKKVQRIPLNPSDVDMLVFVTKNPAPMVPHLEELSRRGFQMSFQVTVNPYGPELEPGVPSNDDVVRAVSEVADRIGKDRVFWRYDPVVFSERFDLDYHRGNFERLASSLCGSVSRCIFSFLEVYDKHAPLFESGRLREVSEQERTDFARVAGAIANTYGIPISHCCARRDYSEFGVMRRGCMDAESYREWGVPYEPGMSGLRDGCTCVKSMDVGAYDTCMHNCVYCYANRADEGRRRSRTYDPESEILFGRVEPGDEVSETRHRSSARLTDFI